MASLYDYLRVFLILCIFIAALFRGPRTWIKVQAIGSLLMGLPTLLFPGFLLSRLASSAKPDGLHLILVQASTLLALSSSIFYALCSATKDKMVFSSLLWSSVVSCGLAAYMTSTTHFREVSKFNDTHLYFLVLGCCMLFAINTWQLIHYWDHARGAFHLNKVNACLIADIALSLGGFVFDFCFTTHSLGLQSQKTDFYHAYVLRLGATMNLGSVVLLVMALWFSSPRDKQALFKSRIAICVAFMLCLLVARVTGNLAMTWKDAGLYCLAALPAVFGAAGLYLSSPSLKVASAEWGHYYLRDRKD